jgi:F-type H+-transporting ATPase subunit delta
MLDNNLAHPYTNAIFEIAESKNIVAQLLLQIEQLVEITTNKDVLDIVNNPNSNEQILTELLTQLINNLDESLLKLVTLLYSTKKLDLLAQICVLYKQKVSELRGSATAIVQSATVLTNEQQQQITQALTQRIGKQVNLTLQHNPSIIGGLIITIDDQAIDYSIRSKLIKLTNHLIQH